MVKPKKRGGAYELTIQFEREDDIAAITSEMLWEMNLLAELDDCLLWHEFAVGEG
jgi:integrase/recombinase XerD